MWWSGTLEACPPPSTARGVFRIIKTQRGGGPPQTKVTTVRKNEIYKRETLVGPFLVHKLFAPPPLPLRSKDAPPPPACAPACGEDRTAHRPLMRAAQLRNVHRRTFLTRPLSKGIRTQMRRTAQAVAVPTLCVDEVVWEYSPRPGGSQYAGCHCRCRGGWGGAGRVLRNTFYRKTLGIWKQGPVLHCVKAAVCLVSMTPVPRDRRSHAALKHTHHCHHGSPRAGFWGSRHLRLFWVGLGQANGPHQSPSPPSPQVKVHRPLPLSDFLEGLAASDFGTNCSLDPLFLPLTPRPP